MNIDYTYRLDEQMEQRARDIESARLSGAIRPYSVTELADIRATEQRIRERADDLAGRLLADARLNVFRTLNSDFEKRVRDE